MVHLLDVDHVSKSFGGIVAVREMSLSVDGGDILGLIGPNGAGKTTLFNLITGVYRPDSGKIVFKGQRISGMKPHRIARAGIARTFQIVRPFPKMTVMENVMAAAIFGGGKSSKVPVKEQVMDLLSQMALDGKARNPAGSLTLPEQRRLELAKALATKPDMLMLDEVMAGLSPPEIQGMIALLTRIHDEEKMTMVVTEHVMRAIVQLCNRILVMNQGEKLLEGDPAEVMQDRSVIAAYMGERKKVGKAS